MNSYKQMVVNWSIFTLFTQLIFCACSIHGNAEPLRQSHFLCNEATEIYLKNGGEESSLMFDLSPGLAKELCKKVLIAPEFHSFMVHLDRANVTVSKSSISDNNDINRVNRSCPLIIHQLTANELPWRLDPCQLEMQNDSAASGRFRLMQGHLEIVWNHSGFSSNYKLSVTMFARGMTCNSENEHSCVKIGPEPLLCIPSVLLCDGIEHCPPGITTNSDEDAEMCANYVQPPKQMSVWELIASGFLKHIFGMDQVTVYSSESDKDVMPRYEEEVEIDIGGDKSDQSGLSKGLSRYGPWGYLMLGMLLCGGVLLLCGLWECCCRRRKQDTADILNTSITIETRPSPVIRSPSSSPSDVQSSPQYDDIADQPPSYADLFPVGNKLENDSLAPSFVTLNAQPSNSSNSN